MPNYCYYDMQVKGKSENLDEFMKVLTDYDHAPHFWRVFEASIYDEYDLTNGDKVLCICGECAWSVNVCMNDGEWSYAKRDPQRSSSLKIESERLQLEIEVFSEESGFGFQEHYHYDNGHELCNDCVDYREYYFDETDYPGNIREDRFMYFIADCGLEEGKYSLDDLNENSMLIIGGFENYCEFSF